MKKIWLVLVLFALVACGSGTPTAAKPQAENGTWQVWVIGVATSPASLFDANGGSVSPKSGYQFLIVSTKLINVSSDFQELWVGLNQGDATLKDSGGNPYKSIYIRRTNETIPQVNGLNMDGVKPSEEGDFDFIFIIPINAGVSTFQYKDLSPISISLK